MASSSSRRSDWSVITKQEVTLLSDARLMLCLILSLFYYGLLLRVLSHTIDLPKETTSLLRPLSTVPTMLTLSTS